MFLGFTLDEQHSIYAYLRLIMRNRYFITDTKPLTIKDYYYQNFLSFSKKHFISLTTLKCNMDEA